MGNLFRNESHQYFLLTRLVEPIVILANGVGQHDSSFRWGRKSQGRLYAGETLRREIWKVITGVTLEVNATIQLKPSGEPGIRAKVRHKPAKKEPEEGDA